MRAVQTWTIL